MTIISLCLIAVSIAIFLIAFIQFSFLNRHDRLTRRLLRAAAALILSILAIEGAFACQSGRLDLCRTVFTDVMQAFSLDADYGAVATRPWSAFGSANFRLFLSVYSLMLYTLAPFLGGAVVYDVLASVSPEIKLAFCRRKEELYIFSELNERTVLLAESISEHKTCKGKYALIFTDAYTSSSREEENELLLRAKALGSICLRDDLLNCHGLRSTKKAYYFLMDVKEEGFNDSKNLATLFQMLNGPAPNASLHSLHKGSFMKDLETRLQQMLNVPDPKAPLCSRHKECDIFFFSDSSEAIENVRIIKKAYDKAYDESHPPRPDRPEESKAIENDRIKKGAYDKSCPPRPDRPEESKAIEEKNVKVSVIRDAALTAGILLRSKPLYQTLGAPQRGVRRELRVVIFGDNLFSRELFKTVFWMGQLIDVQLCITVVYDPGTAGENAPPRFEAYLDRVCPEIIPSCTVDREEDCLRIWPGENNFAPPYAKLAFIETDIYAEALRPFLDRGDRVYAHCSNESYRLADYDVFYVAGEDDLKNAELANNLCSALMYLHGKSNRKDRPRQMIAVMVQNDEISQIVRSRFADAAGVLRNVHGVEPPELDLFGSLKTRCSYQFVFSSEEELTRHKSESEAKTDEHGSADISAAKDDIYTSWSNIGRNLHLPYKMYCAGCTGGNFVEDALKYRRVMESDHDLFVKLSWLEHRRWNAFLRAQGFTMAPISLELLEEAFGPVMPALLRAQTKEQAREVLKSVKLPAPLAKAAASGQGVCLPRINAFKDIQSKIHPCLLESSPEEIQDPDRHDYLDLITAARLYIDLIDSFKPDEWQNIKSKKLSGVKTYDKPWSKKYLPILNQYEVLRWYYERKAPEKVESLPRSGEGLNEAWDALLQSDPPLARELSAYENYFPIDLPASRREMRS